ncbi:MAG: hypothetical protein ACOH18_04445 [Candidatus Saccharimonadaceae bacterium]
MIKMRTTQNKNRKTLLILAILLLVVLGTVAVYAITRPSTQGPTEQQKTEQNTTQNNEKQQYIEATNNPDNEPKPAPVPSSSDTISISANKAEGNSVTIITQLDGYASGSCELVITNGAKTYTATVSILYQPEHSTCAGYSVPIASLGNGTWHIKLSVTPSNGTSVVKEIDYAVQ